MTLIGASLKFKKVPGGYQQSVNVNYQLFKNENLSATVLPKDSNIVKAAKYNLNGPVFQDTLNPPSFIDNQRYVLNNGFYTSVTEVKDNNNFNSKPVKIVEKLALNFIETRIGSSSIQILESFKKTVNPGPLSKSGFDLIPYNINYFPETQNELSFYFESYNTDTVLGKNKPFIYKYYLQSAETEQTLGNYSYFKKQITAKVNPLLAKIDITKLNSGNYNLVIEIRDEKNILQMEKKYFFQRLNKALDMAMLNELYNKKTVNDYFGSCDNLDTLRMFVECLWPIANNVDKDRIINQSVKKDKDMMRNFVIDFWQKRASDTANPLKLWGEYYKSVQEVMVLFKCGKQPGYYTERGRVYLQYGPPSQRSIQNTDLNTFPYEIWQYYRLTDKVTGQFFSNRKFVFVNKNIADDCHVLVHSDMRGEIYNERWRFEVSRRNSNGIGNPDNIGPAGTQYNQFDDIYSNPR